MIRFKYHKTGIEDLWIVEHIHITDSRGSFSRMFCVDEFKRIKQYKPIVQVNLSENLIKGTVRGMHFQFPPYAEVKYVNCIKGRIFDVAVDLRKGSKTFLKWFGIELAENSSKMLVVPEGFAHGFQTLVDNSTLIYFSTYAYNHSFEESVNVLDPKVRIEWKLPITEMSQKDKNKKFLPDSFEGVEL